MGNLNQKKERLALLDGQIKELHSQLQTLGKEYKSLNEEILDAEFPAELTPQIIMQSPYTTFETKNGYETLVKYMSQFKSISLSGYFPDTLRRCLEVQFNNAEPFEPQMKECLLFIPYCCDFTVERILEKKSYNYTAIVGKYIKIYEFSLSARGSYFLLVQDSRTLICKTTYGSTSVLEEFPSVEKALNYVYENLPVHRFDDSDDDF